MAAEQKGKEEKVKSLSFQETISRNLGILFLIFMAAIIYFMVSFQQEVKTLHLALAKQIESLTQENERVNQQLGNLFSEINKISQISIDRDQFTEIYMQLQELTGMISNEVKREFYITKIVKVISQHNKTMESKEIYEIARTIYEESLKYNFNPLLLTSLIKVESNFDPQVVSDSYAYGLCQVRRFIAPELAEKLGISWDGAEKTLFDPIKNIKIGTYYLSILNRDLEDINLAIIAYNQGPYAVQETLSRSMALDENYLNKVMDYFNSLRGFSLEEITEENEN